MGLKKNNPGCGCCEECEAACNYCTGDVMPCQMQLEISGMADNNCAEADCYKHNGTYILSADDACYFYYARDDLVCGAINEYRIWFGNLRAGGWGILCDIEIGGSFAAYETELSATEPFDCYNHDGVIVPWYGNYQMDDCDYENATIKVTSGDLL